jgi:hypothetical protein
MMGSECYGTGNGGRSRAGTLGERLAERIVHFEDYLFSR